MTYTYNTKVNCSRKVVFFSNVLSRHLSSLTVVLCRISHFSDTYCNVPPCTLRLRLLPRLETFKNDVKRSISGAQERYKKAFGKNVRMSSIYKGGQLVYMMKPPRAVLSWETDKVVHTSYNGHAPRVSGPYKNITARENKFAILGDSIKNTITNDCPSRASCLDKSHRARTSSDNILEK